jgi:hypothetical protein
VPVTVDNFKRAESDLYFGNAMKDAGAVGKFGHHREPVAVDKQIVIRPNRDTLYSPALIDLDAGPVTVTLPDAGGRFRSMQVINEDHYVVGDVIYNAGAYTYDKDKAGTRYILIALRTLVDPNVWLGFVPFNTFWKISPVIVLLLLLVGLFIPMGWGAPSGPAIVVRHSVQIIPDVAGEVIEVPVQPNTPLKAGDVLFRIDPTPYEAQVNAVDA